jgi:Rrf2 family protein
MLRLGGFVTAARGTGGYTLARPASQIVISEVLALLGGRLFEGDFCETHTGQKKACVRSVDCSLRVLWRTVQAAVDDVLSRTTLEDLLRDEQQMITWATGLGEFASHISRQ